MAAFDAAPAFDVGRALSGPSRSKGGSGGVGRCRAESCQALARVVGAASAVMSRCMSRYRFWPHWVPD